MSNKKVFWDISPNNKRSIREIPVSEEKGSFNIISERKKEVFEDDFTQRNFLKKWSLRFLIFFAVALSSTAVFFSLFFAGADVVVTPRQEKLSLSGDFNAVASTTDNGIQYQIITLAEKESKKISANGEEYVERKASGIITVYNDFNSSSQRLIKNTRFETSDGLTYRIDKTIVVPGNFIKDGKVYPGSVEATVYADKPGDKYNLTELKDFSIPGFKGTARFEKFYAKSKTPIIGGFIGNEKKVSKELLEKSRDEIHASLKEKLVQRIYSEKAKELVLFNDGIFVEYESLPNLDSDKKDSVDIQEQATLYAVVFDQNELNDHIIKNIYLPKIENTDKSGNDEIDIVNINDLNFKILDKENSKPWEKKGFTFSIGGDAEMVWIFDEDKLKNNLAGQSRENIGTLLFGFSGIKEAEIKIVPFWRGTIPKDPQKIQVERIINF